MKKFALLWLVLAMLFAVAACDKNDDDDNDAASADDDAALDDDDTAADDDDDDSSPGPVELYQFTLSFEVEFQAVLKMKQYADGTLDGVLIPGQGFDVVTAGTTLQGSGKLWQFPEANGRMIMLKLQGPSVPGGKCGDEPISYSLTLTAKENNGYLVGGLAAYCGADNYTGRVARLLRLSGVQQPAK